MLAEALACVLLPLALGRASGSDVVAPVAVAVCALTLGPTIFAFFLGTGRRAQGSNFTRIYNETYAHSRFNRFLLELTRLQKQRRRNARRRAAAKREPQRRKSGSLQPSPPPLPAAERRKRRRIAAAQLSRTTTKPYLCRQNDAAAYAPPYVRSAL